MGSYYDVDAILTDAQVILDDPIRRAFVLTKLVESSMHLRADRAGLGLPGGQHERRCKI